MKQQLIQIESLAKQARKAAHRGWDEKAAQAVAELRDLLDAIDPLRCDTCGMKTRARVARLRAHQFNERIQSS